MTASSATCRCASTDPCRACVGPERSCPCRARRSPAVDAHNHLGRWLTGRLGRRPMWTRCSASMDAWNVEAIVNLDGMWGDELEANLERYDRAHPGRFARSRNGTRRWFELERRDGSPRSCATRSIAGARGLKVWKDLGLHLRDERRLAGDARRPAAGAASGTRSPPRACP